MEFAIEDPDQPGHYESRRDAAHQQVHQPHRAHGAALRRSCPSANDYEPGDGALLVWGRPHFSRRAGPPGADLPAGASAADRARTRTAAGASAPGSTPASTSARTDRRIWSRQQAQAKPLALDGVVGGSPFEEQPLVNQFTISWVGGIDPQVGDALRRQHRRLSPRRSRARPPRRRSGLGPHPLRGSPVGAVVAREAAPARGLAVRGRHAARSRRRAVPSAAASTSPARRARAATRCARSTSTSGCFPIGKTFDNGFFYGANIIDAYTAVRRRRRHGHLLERVDLESVRRAVPPLEPPARVSAAVRPTFRRLSRPGSR